MVVWKLSAVCGSGAGAAQCLSALVLLMGFGGAQAWLLAAGRAEVAVAPAIAAG